MSGRLPTAIKYCVITATAGCLHAAEHPLMQALCRAQQHAGRLPVPKLGLNVALGSSSIPAGEPCKPGIIRLPF